MPAKAVLSKFNPCRQYNQPTYILKFRFFICCNLQGKELVTTTQQVTHLTEQLVTLLNKVQVHKVHPQATTTLVQTHCLLLTQVSKLVFKFLCS